MHPVYNLLVNNIWVISVCAKNDSQVYYGIFVAIGFPSVNTLRRQGVRKVCEMQNLS